MFSQIRRDERRSYARSRIPILGVGHIINFNTRQENKPPRSARLTPNIQRDLSCEDCSNKPRKDEMASRKGSKCDYRTPPFD